MTYAITAEALTKSFGDTRALDGIDLAVPAGTVLGLLGPNGAGKTTAVRILATLLTPDAGRATIGGYDIATHANDVRRVIGLTGQYASVDELLTGRANLVLFGRLLGLGRAGARQRAATLLEDFGLAAAADRRVKTYSGGMRRRLDLAASLIGHPQVIFLDEPTTGLDPGKREDVWAMVRGLAGSGTTVLLTTQYLEEAEALARDIVVIDDGRVIASGTPAELKQIVGSRALQVRPADPAQLPAVREVLERFSGRRAEQPSPGLLAVPGDDALTTDVVIELRRRGIVVAELALKLPDLDEVFFTLTGRGGRTASSPDTASPPDTTASQDRETATAAGGPDRTDEDKELVR